MDIGELGQRPNRRSGALAAGTTGRGRFVEVSLCHLMPHGDQVVRCCGRCRRVIEGSVCDPVRV